MNENRVFRTVAGLRQNLRVKWLLLAVMAAATITCQKTDNAFVGPLTDPRDGQVYQTVTIGSQIWMAENLNYRPDSGSWYYDNDSASYAAIFGRLYNWATAMTVAPPGWHLPTDEEWTTLTNYLGGDTTVGGLLCDTTNWNPRLDATNTTGFSALPGGDRYWQTGVFYSFGDTGFWWTATTSDSTYQAYDRDITTWQETYSHIYRHSYNKIDAFSVRCVKD